MAHHGTRLPLRWVRWTDLRLRQEHLFKRHDADAGCLLLPLRLGFARVVVPLLLRGSGVGPWRKYVTDDDPRLLDTGWRDVAGSLEPNWRLTSQRGECEVRREGSTVWWRIRISSLAADPALAKILTIPQGFRPDLGSNIPFVVLAPPARAIETADHISAFSMYADDQAALSPTTIVRQSTPAEYTWVWAGSYLTNDPWPTTLPGDTV